MSQITVSDLTFCYEGSYDNVFEKVSFVLDTDWKLGMIGRNGKGKTTFLRLLYGAFGGERGDAAAGRRRAENGSSPLQGKTAYEYKGSISASTAFDYFPYEIRPGQEKLPAAELFDLLRPGYELWRVLCELEQLSLDPECLYRPFSTLSQGERTKALLALLFSQENFFLLIDEPTNHLDGDARKTLQAYLNRKKGFLLVSHDRELLDACIDHVLVLNRKTIQVEKGNFSSWWENKEKRDQFQRSENEKRLREIGKLREAADRTARWAEQSERSKIGFDPVREHDRSISTRSYIGAKTKKMQSRVKNTKRRLEAEIESREGLLQDIESPAELKLTPLSFHKEIYVLARELCLGYPVRKEGSAEKDSTIEFELVVGMRGYKYDSPQKEARAAEYHTVLRNLNLELHRGERILLQGGNGCGKSSLIKAILRADAAPHVLSGILEVPSGLKISYVNQDTSFLRGSLSAFAVSRGLEESLLLALLRQLDFDRVQFGKRMEDYSEGQKKKVLLAASLLTSAHLYIWDEPLNYIDLFSRMQLEKLILDYRPTMLLVEHDAAFGRRVADRVVSLTPEPSA
ncbi:MAG: ATP-binding cassette domain-containing protein [Roseburia sp.]|nr:ATP-binding cassette domain-containing protein [Roseburia sp.]MCM1099545.1 ATP-binding cassette domain-containing protein [Ruminococcus flavefaciens]